MRYPAFTLFCCGYLLSCTGSAMVPVALIFAIYEQGHDATQASWVMTAETIPLVGLILAGGTIADRLPRRHVMLGADIICGAAQAALACLLAFHHGSLGAIMALAAVLGAGNAFCMPARRGLVPQLVPATHVQGANALISIAQAAGNIAGPVIGGLLVAAGGAAWAVGADAASYGISALCLALIASASITSFSAEEEEDGGFLRQIVAGWHAFRTRLWLWLTVVQFALFHLLAWGPLMVLGAWHFAHVSRGASLWGGVLSGMGVGSVIGGLIGLRWRPTYALRAARLTFLPFAALPAALAMSLPYAACVCAAVLAGIGSALFGVLWETLLAREIPAGLRARIGAYDAFGSICLLPAGYALAGPMANLIGADGMLGISGAFVVLATITALLPRTIRNMRSS